MPPDSKVVCEDPRGHSYEDIHWTPAWRSVIVPSRAIPNPGWLAARAGTLGLAYPFDVANAWETLAAYSRTRGEPEAVQLVPLGYSSATPELADHARRALAAYGQRLDVLDADIEAAMATLGLRDSTAAALWIAYGGVQFATRVLVTMMRWRANKRGPLDPDRRLFLVEDRQHAAREVRRSELGLHFLRGALGDASEEHYHEARAIADAARRTLTPEGHAAIAYAFPDEPWGVEVVDSLLAAPIEDSKNVRALALTVMDLDGAIRLARAGARLTLAVGATLLARHGVATAKIAAASFEATGDLDEYHHKDAGDVLARIGTREALEAFVPMFGKAHFGWLIEGAFKRRPDLAREVLAPLAARSKRAAKLLAALAR